MNIVRVHYRERQRLTAADLRAEQDYRLGLTGRHHLTHHDWGVVRGLRVIGSVAQGFTLTRGVAIDGYGREIVVPEPLALAIDHPERCAFVLLYYCEYPEQAPPGRPCEDDPAPRVAQRVKRSSIVEDFTPPATALDDVGRARAAGRLADLRPWPVVVARIGSGCVNADGTPAPLVDYVATRYVRHRAGVIRSPTGRALLQLGLARRTDVYHFLLSTRDNGNVLSRRVGIDRDAVTRVWRPLIIKGATATARVEVAQGQFLQITTDMPGGLGRRVQVAGLIDLEERTLSASLLDLGERRADQRRTVEGHETFALKQSRATLEVGAHVASFSLVGADAEAVALGPPLEVKAKRKKGAQSAPAVPSAAAFSVTLTPTRGKLVMRSLPRSSDVVAAECADVERNRADAGERGTPVVRFRPASGMAGDPFAREIHAVTTSRPIDPVPRTELRLSGGSEDDTDTSSRLCVGAWRHKQGQPEWFPVLRMDGGRRLEMLTAPGIAAPTALLHVDGAVYLPPIGKKDPLLADMMSMAFIAGLRLMGRLAASKATVAPEMPPAPEPPGTVPLILRGETLKYKLTLTYPKASLKRCIEIVRGTAGTGDVAFRSIPLDQLPKDGATTSLTTASFTHSASRVVIEVLLLVAENGVSTVVVSNSLELSVGS